MDTKREGDIQVMKSKKFAALMLSLAMITGAMPGYVLADDNEEETQGDAGVSEEVQEEEQSEEETEADAEEAEQADVYESSNNSITFENGTLTLAGDVNRTAINEVVEDPETVIHVTALPGTRIVKETYWSGLFGMMSNVEDIDISNAVLADDTDSLAYMFWNCKSLKTITFPEHFDTSKVTNMSRMFYDCKVLESIDTGDDFDTASVEDMSCMFSGCKTLTEIDLSKFDTGSVKNMYSMFDNCSSVTSLDLSGFDTKNVTDMSYMFEGCESLGTVTLGKGFDTSAATFMMNMFYGCSSLETIKAFKAFDLSSDVSTEYMFYGCTSLKGFDPDCTDGTYARANSPAGLGYLTIEEAASILGYSLTLNHNIGINFYAYIEDDTGLSATYDWGTGIDVRTGISYVHSDVPAEITPITDEEESELYGGANYKFTCYVAARAMTDEVELTVMSGNDELLTDSYHVVDYLGDAVKIYPNNKKMHYLLNMMLLYGDQAQTYFDYRTEDPAVDYLDLTCIENDQYLMAEFNMKKQLIDNAKAGSASVVVYDSEVTVKTIDPAQYGLSYYGSSLSCKTAIKQRIYFKIEDPALADSTTIALEPSSNRFNLLSVNKSGKYLVVDVELLDWATINDKMTLVFTNGDTAGTFTYTPKDYMKSVFSSSADAELIETRGVLVAMQMYTLALNEYIRQV